MAQPLNTFVVILLAFPFYLAQKGRLAAFVDLAKPSNAATPAQTSAATASATPTSTAASSGVTSAASTAATAFSTFADATALFS
jgi:uncharacterized membrane protein